MSEVDLKLEWAERQTRERLEGDSYQGGEIEDEEALIEEALALPPEDEVDWPEEFEWSHDRALALEVALGKVASLTAARLQGHLRLLLSGCRERQNVTELLDLTEAWLSDRLADWKVVPTVHADDPEQAAAFNQSLECGENALSLAQEIVGLLRADELDLVERLIEQVGQYLLEARDNLLAAEPREEADGP